MRAPAGHGDRGILAGDLPAGAAVDAQRAAQEAGLVVRAAESVPEVDALIRVGEAVWGPQGTFTRNELRALAFAGSVVLGAYDRRDEDSGPVGFLVGFLGWNGGLHLHSHQTGVLPARRGGGVGYALKLAQREICLRRDIDEVRWTFDPLVRRNAWFNLRRLGARAERFHPDFYGRMSDAVNENDLSDRLEAVWSLCDPVPADPPEEGRLSPGAAPGTARPAVLVAADGRPRETGLPPSAGHHVAIPADFGRLRDEDPARARDWRLAVRRVLGAAYGAGLRIGRIDGDGYVLTEAHGD